MPKTKPSPRGGRAPNSRNGSSKKTVQSEDGELDLSIPRDRRGSFEPILVPKHQRRIAGLDEKILALYARGNSTRDISAQLEELYGGAKISAAVISEVIESVSEDVKAWQSRPLDEVYPIVYLDALYVNIKVSGRVSKRAVYVVLGIDREGDKQLLGLWVGEAETEGAKFWLKVLTDLRNRGLKDILIACCDGLKGFPQAIEAVYPQTQVQLCIVHLMRNCMKYVPWKDRKAVAADLKPIYQAATLAESEAALDAFAAKWDEAYPAVARSGYGTGRTSSRYSITQWRSAASFTPPTPSSRSIARCARSSRPRLSSLAKMPFSD